MPVLKRISLDEWNNFLLFELQLCPNVSHDKKEITLFIAKSLSVIAITSVWQILTGGISGSVRMYKYKPFDINF